MITDYSLEISQKSHLCVNKKMCYKSRLFNKINECSLAREKIWISFV